MIAMELEIIPILALKSTKIILDKILIMLTFTTIFLYSYQSLISFKLYHDIFFKEINKRNIPIKNNSVDIWVNMYNKYSKKE